MPPSLPVRPALHGLRPYQGPLKIDTEAVGATQLASNENTRGPSPKVQQAVQAALATMHRYPDGPATHLRQQIATREQVGAEQVLVGNGSNEIIELVARATLEPGCNAVYSQYCFAIYPLATAACGAQGRAAPAREYGHDLEAMAAQIDADTRLVFIANPNNPTGTVVPSPELKAFVRALPPHLLVFLDLAYGEYVTDDPDYPSYATWRDLHPGLVVSKTFSKVHGLAALRIGYGLCAPELADYLNRIRQPFNANALAQVAATAALADRAYVRDCVRTNIGERARLFATLAAMGNSGVRPIPSAANFLMLECAVCDADTLVTRLRAQQVLVRSLASYDLPQCVRVTIGTPEENDRFVRALRECLHHA